MSFVPLVRPKEQEAALSSLEQPGLEVAVIDKWWPGLGSDKGWTGIGERSGKQKTVSLP